MKMVDGGQIKRKPGRPRKVRPEDTPGEGTFRALMSGKKIITVDSPNICNICFSSNKELYVVLGIASNFHGRLFVHFSDR